MNSLLSKIGIAFFLIGTAFAIGRYTAPVKVEEKQVITKETEYITREIAKPDGTIVKETIKKDTATKDTQKTVDNKKPDYKVSVIPQYNFSDKKMVYGASVEKRIVGPFFVGIYADTNSNVGASISMEF
jgi:hypothetical protein